MDLNYLSIDSFASMSMESYFDLILPSQARGKRLVVNSYSWEPEPVAPWMDDAKCVGLEPTLFEFDQDDLDYQRLSEVQEVCNTCPVKDACLANSSPADRKYTVRGGKTPSVFRTKKEMVVRGVKCKNGHDWWYLRPNGKHQCETCTKINRKGYRDSKVG